jgi:hypothetical protein
MVAGEECPEELLGHPQVVRTPVDLCAEGMAELMGRRLEELMGRRIEPTGVHMVAQRVRDPRRASCLPRARR